ncbi:hypothetical protein SAZ10_31925 [Mesorhizobium sp. BAC0120]|uniref:hypothetical protein n=1 Tax=Mesorhizobium sp. BAC0120 TaxID=3090670 RepID=UPI00298C7F7C|nr:hypothetical protein [Mesorhizobium sp. BAC0120]MDW6026379.1 hypothetical protein [Mesorhizobium sp. BAC0120]
MAARPEGGAVSPVFVRAGNSGARAVALAVGAASVILSAMTKLDQIEKSIASLSDDEFKELVAWFDELRWQRWDRQFENDVKAGRLDRLITEARAEIAAGKTRPL